MPSRPRIYVAAVDPGERLVAFVQEVGRHARHRRGWKAELAKITGLDPSYVGRLHAGKRPGDVSDRLISQLHQRIGLRGEYFRDNPNAESFLMFWEPSDLLSVWKRRLPEIRAKAAVVLVDASKGRSVSKEDAVALAEALVRLPPFYQATRVLDAQAGDMPPPTQDEIRRLANDVDALIAGLERVGVSPSSESKMSFVERLQRLIDKVDDRGTP